jgi:murein L,D-transpeptidase YafK
MFKRICVTLAAVAATLALWGCAKIEIAPHLMPLSTDTMMLLGKKGMSAGAAIFVRIFKEESELEVWKQREDGHFYHFKTYPICNWSGELGPKVTQGDKQAPEGFYTITQRQMNPNSQFHLAFNLGYPNAYDRSLKRTGDFLMIHGQCKSAGCYAMTDALIEEIYALAREAFIGGQESFAVHAFPFRMTDANMVRFKNSPNYKFWVTLKEGYDYFEQNRLVPNVAVCERRYIINARFSQGMRVSPEGACPTFERAVPEPFSPLPMQDASYVVVNGPKTRTASADGSGGGSQVASSTATSGSGSTLGKWFGLGMGGSLSTGFGLGSSR